MARSARKSGRCFASSTMRARSLRPEITAAMERCSSQMMLVALFIRNLLEAQEDCADGFGNRGGARQSPRAEAQNQEAGGEAEGARGKPAAHPRVCQARTQHP